MDENIISFNENTIEYENGIDLITTNKGVTFDMKTGEELSFLDLGIDEEAFWDKVKSYLYSRLDEYDVDYDNYPVFRSVLEGESGPEYWVLNAKGIEVNFYKSMMDMPISLSIDCASIIVPYEELRDVMKPEYCGFHGTCVVDMPYDETIFIDDFELAIERNYDTDNLLISLNDDCVEILNSTLWRLDSHLIIQPDGLVSIIATIEMEDSGDAKEVKIFEIEDGVLTEKQTIIGSSTYYKWGVRDFSLDRCFNILGTRWGKMNYALDENGEYVCQEEFFEFDYYRVSDLMTIKSELPAFVDGEKTTLPVGTKIFITATDNNGILKFVTKDRDIFGEIHYEEDTEQRIFTIDGVSEYDYFEEIPYSKWLFYDWDADDNKSTGN